jgi:hypothetical protein
VARDGAHVLEIAETERIELQLPDAARYAGGQVVNGTVRPLPIGSSLDPRVRRFSWQPAPGFLGAYDLLFAPQDARAAAPIRVRAVVGPPLRMTIEQPSTGLLAARPFVVAGWALDLAARDGAGIDTVHVWAYPAGGRDPIFLGVAVTGDPRPDVAAIYGPAFERCAYHLVAKALPPGTYIVTVYAHRAATGAFDGVQTVTVTVR